jgi:hypothetical protein
MRTARPDPLPHLNRPIEVVSLMFLFALFTLGALALWLLVLAHLAPRW